MGLSGPPRRLESPGPRSSGAPNASSRAISRREALTVLLGAPVAAAACKSGPPPERPVEGGIVGANETLGHKLRDGLAPQPSTRRRVPVVIVGGGVAGLSAAWRLARAGVGDFELLELDDVLGGTARPGENDVGAFPWGAHYVPAPLPHARAMIELLVEAGAGERDPETGGFFGDEAQLCRAPEERLFVADRWYEGLFPWPGARPEELAERDRFEAEMARWGEWRDGRGRRAFAVPMAHGSDDAEITALDRISMAEWLDAHGYRSRRLRWYVEYGCRDDFGATLETTSAWAGIHYFASRFEAGDTQPFLTWPEGNGHLVAHLARRASAAGGVLRPGVAVTKIRQRSLRDSGRIDEGSPIGEARSFAGAEVWAFEPATGRSEILEADQVVVCLPRVFAARLLGDEETVREAREQPVSPWLVANLTLSRRPRSRGFPEAWDNVLYGSAGLGYVVATHQLDAGIRTPGVLKGISAGGGDALRPAGHLERRAPSSVGPTVWTYYLPLTNADPLEARRHLLALTFAEAADAVLSDLKRAHPDVRECVSRIDVWRWGHGMARPTPGFAFGEARRRACEPRGAIHFAHTDLSGLPLFEEAQHHGVRAAEEVLTARAVRFEPLG